jgi:hypothetical protein
MQWAWTVFIVGVLVLLYQIHGTLRLLLEQAAALRDQLSQILKDRERRSETGRDS